MTGNEMIALSKILMGNSQISDNAILKIFNLVLNVYGGYLSMQRRDTYYHRLELIVGSGVDEVPLPDGSLYSGAAQCVGHVDFLIPDLAGALPLIVVNPGDWPRRDPGVPAEYCVKGGAIIFDREHDREVTYILHYFGLPAEAAANDTEIEVPAEFQIIFVLLTTALLKVRWQQPVENVLLILTLLDAKALTTMGDTTHQARWKDLLRAQG
jgi:hypothetical protein